MPFWKTAAAQNPESAGSLTEKQQHFSKRQLEWLQVGRALAALAVVLFHAGENWTPWFRGGGVGVDLFFVISGFIIAHAHTQDIGRPRQLGRYAWRRFTRIYPFYWVICALVLPLYFFVPSAGDGSERNAINILSTVSLAPFGPRPIIGVAWTLVLEVTFYTVFALAIVNRRIGTTALVLWFGTCAVNLFWPFATAGVGHAGVDPRFLEFGGGMLVALGAHRLTGRTSWGALSIGLVGLLVTPLLLGVLTDSQAIIPFTPERASVGIWATLFVAGLVGIEGNALRPPRVLRFLGDATYSIYLVHGFAWWVLDAIARKYHLYAHLPAWLSLSLLACAMVVVSCGFYLLIEAPLQRTIRSLATRRAIPRWYSREPIRPAPSV